MKKTLVVATCAALLLPVMSGCAQETASSTSEVVFVGMMGAPKVLDPAGTRSLDDATLLQQIYPSVLNSSAGAGEVVPEIGVSAEYTSEFEFTVELKPDLTFSNGHALTASDVAHSINRIKTINDPAGPAVLLQNLESVTAMDDTTVVFVPTRGFDQALPAVLAGLPGLVVDEEVFPADRLLNNGEVAGSNAFAGPYTIGGYSEGAAVRLNPNPAYAGAWGVPTNKGVELRYYNNADNLMYDSTEMAIDVAIVHRQSLTASTGAATEAFAVDFTDGPKVETGLLLINGKSEVLTLPGDRAEKQARDLREILTSIFDQQAIVKEAFGELYPAAAGIVPEEMGGAGARGRDEVPSGRDAQRALKNLDVAMPLSIELSYPETYYGPSVTTLMQQVKVAIDDTLAFEIVLKPLSDEDFVAARQNHDYEILFDYHYPLFADSEAFLYPMIGEASQLGADDETIQGLSGRLGLADKGIYDQHNREMKRVEENLGSTELFVPLVWAGRQALVRDGIQGGAEMLAVDGKLVLAKLYRVILK